MKNRLLILAGSIVHVCTVLAQPCTPQGNQTTYGTNDTWIGYVYNNYNFANYRGYVNEGTPGNPDFDRNFGGSNVSYATNGCPVQTETFSVRYKLQKTFAAGDYEFTVGGDDGFRLSIDGGATWLINQWNDQPYTTSNASVTLNGTYNLVLEYYENGGDNRISFTVQPTCIGGGSTTVFGTNDVWIGYVYDGTNFNTYKGMVTEGTPGYPNFDQNFGGDNVTYNTSDCPVTTETFSVRYRLRKTFNDLICLFVVGADDGYRLSLDGGGTWVINNWGDHGYTVTSFNVILNGTYDLVLEFYENGGGNRISFDLSTTLPIKLLSFNATKKEQGILLNWATSRDSNPNYFVVEKSKDGFSFTTAGTVKGKEPGITNTVDYTFTDYTQVAGNSYYRLQMADKDGQITYSPVITVGSTVKEKITFFPTIVNPSGTFYIKSGQATGKTSLLLFDMSGKKIMEQLMYISTPGETIALSMPPLVKGYYRVLVRNDKELLAGKTILVQ